MVDLNLTGLMACTHAASLTWSKRPHRARARSPTS